MSKKQKITIIGAGPAGLFAAYQLLHNGFQVDLYDQSSGVAKKFLVAGKGGLNLTHSEDLEFFHKRYYKDSEFFKELLLDFSPKDLRQWCESIGVETFVGSSGRIFPKTFKAADILTKWINVLKGFSDFKLYLKHKFISMDQDKNLLFDHQGEEVTHKAEILILALGGASWSKTGSDGKWVSILEKLGVSLEKFRPMNCGFEIQWSEGLQNKVDRSAVKNIALSLDSESVKGEVMLTPWGIEGGAIYALSRSIRKIIEQDGHCLLQMDLRPALSEEQIVKKLKYKRSKDSLANTLRKCLGLTKAQIALLYELTTKEELKEDLNLARKIKTLPLSLVATRPIDEAISTSGGVKFDELSKSLEVNEIPGVYIVGEMLDFEAPTGGYLLQGCFSTAFRAVQAICSQ